MRAWCWSDDVEWRHIAAAAAAAGQSSVLNTAAYPR